MKNKKTKKTKTKQKPQFHSEILQILEGRTINKHWKTKPLTNEL
jgi:hypothetical protein